MSLRGPMTSRSTVLLGGAGGGVITPVKSLALPIVGAQHEEEEEDRKRRTDEAPVKARRVDDGV